MIDLTPADIENSKTMRERLRALDHDLFVEVYELYKIEVGLILAVAQGLLTDISESLYGVLVHGPLEVESYLQERSRSLAWDAAHALAVV